VLQNKRMARSTCTYVVMFLMVVMLLMVVFFLFEWSPGRAPHVEFMLFIVRTSHLLMLTDALLLAFVCKVRYF